jgi:hypothetical protein
MNSEKIKEFIGIAKESVSDIKDLQQREKTYEIVLNSLIIGEKTSNVESKPSEHVLSGFKKNALIQKKRDLSNSITILSKKFNVSPEKIEDYFEVNGTNFEILCPISMGSSAEEHLMFTILILTLKKIAFDERELNSADLRDMAKSKGIKSLVNLSTNLKKYSQFIIHKSGKKGSTNTSYKLTIDGYNKGVEYIKKILSGEKISAESTPSVSRGKSTNSGMPKEIDTLYNEGFFDTFKTITDVRDELNKRTFFNRRQDIDAYIRQTLTKARGLLIREKKNKTWNYVKKK